MSWYRLYNAAPPAAQLLQVQIDGRQLRLRLEAVTEERFPPQPLVARRNSTHDQHQHRVFHAVLFTDGRGACVVDGRRHECRPGCCVLVDPDRPHRFGAVSVHPFTYRALTFSLVDAAQEPVAIGWHRYCGALFGEPLAPAPTQTLLPAADMQRFMERQRSLIDLLGADARQDASAAAQRCLVDILALLCDRVLAHPQPAGEHPGLLRARQAIEQRYAQRLPVAELAHIAGCSTGRFHTLFRAAMGCTPTAWQLQLRIQAAQTLLRASSLPCKSIATRVGFADTAAFSKAFKKLTGHPPDRWRRLRSGTGSDAIR
ncbi:MAG: helix-turn-helix domain-containing protein [Planctomycetota bacterium]